MDIIVNLPIFLGVAAFMEGVAWALHKYVMHGFLWVLHEDHHRTSERRLQKNDLFALFFALLSFLLIYNGLLRYHVPPAHQGHSLQAALGLYAAHHQSASRTPQHHYQGG